MVAGNVLREAKTQTDWQQRSALTHWNGVDVASIACGSPVTVICWHDLLRAAIGIHGTVCSVCRSDAAEHRGAKCRKLGKRFDS
jgi:hypothetical protein